MSPLTASVVRVTPALLGLGAVPVPKYSVVTEAADPSYNGQFAYFKDMLVATRTDAGGASRLSIAMRRPN